MIIRGVLLCSEEGGKPLGVVLSVPLPPRATLPGADRGAVECEAGADDEAAWAEVREGLGGGQCAEETVPGTAEKIYGRGKEQNVLLPKTAR